MDRNRESFIDHTINVTPEPRACSTVNKKKSARRLHEIDKNYNDKPLIAEESSDESLGIVSIKSKDLDFFDDSDNSASASSDVSLHLKEQRLLAADSLQRASRLSSIPSRYLKPSEVTRNVTETCMNVSMGSTISESDLFRSKAPTDTSTPRMSTASDEDMPFKNRYSLGKSMKELSDKIKNTNISIDNVAQEFNRVMQSIEVDSAIFKPAEEAEAQLMADEMSWREQNDIPRQTSDCFTESNASLPFKMSMGEFFKKKSDTLSDLDVAAPSPVKSRKATALVEPSVVLEDIPEQEQDLDSSSGGKVSLSATEIFKLLAESEETPQKIMQYLFKELQNSGLQASSPPSKQRTCSKEKFNSTENNAGAVPDCNYSILTDGTKTVSGSMNHLDQISAENKENLMPVSVNDTSQYRRSPELGTNKSLESMRSTSSLSNLVNGKLPIDATKTELVWGCVKPGKTIAQEVTIRNKSQNRLRIQCAVSGHSFKIQRDRPETEYASIVRYVLQPGEAKSISVIFAPISIGPAVDSISFTPADPNLQQTRPQRIHLFGYGGYGNVELNNITKDITGKFWLCLGQLDNRTTVRQTIVMQNNGTLPSFAWLSFESKDLCSFSNVDIAPNAVVLLPQEKRHVTLTYTPSRNDLKYFQAMGNTSVIDIGVLKLISGAEAIRGRLRRLCKVAVDKGLSVDPVCSKLIKDIAGEVIPTDVRLFKESVGSIRDLLHELSFKEIVVTLEQDPDRTLVAQFPDDTLHFQTIAQDSTFINDLTVNRFKLEPNYLILTPPAKLQDMFFMYSNCNEDVRFTASIEGNCLEVRPSQGVLKAGKTLVLTVVCSDIIGSVSTFKLIVSIDGHTLEAEIKVLCLNT